MTEFEKEKITQLRTQGYSYDDIAKKLNLKASSIRSYCSRNNILPSICPQCGAPVFQNPNRKRKRFCSTKCRITWWNKHPDLGTRHPHHTQVCPICGQSFDCFKTKPRVYCSRQCYSDARRKAAVHDG